MCYCEGYKGPLSTIVLSRCSARIGDLIHSDIEMFEVPSLFYQFRYFLTFIDDHSRFTVVYLLQTKDEHFKYFVDYDQKLFNKTGRHIATLRADNAYDTKQFRSYTLSHGIHCQLTTFHTPEHNSRAERAMRTIVESINSMLSDAKLPKEY